MSSPIPSTDPTVLVTSRYIANHGLPQVAGLQDGRYVVVWAEVDSTEPYANTVKARIFNADGSAQGEAFLVSASQENWSRSPAIAVLDDGRFVIAWESFSELGPSIDIRARVFDPSQNGAGGTELVVSTFLNANGGYPAIAALSDGGFVVTFTSAHHAETRARVYSSELEPLNDQAVLIGPFNRSIQLTPEVADLKNGTYVVINARYESDSTETEVFAKIVRAADGQVLREFKVNTTSASWQDRPSVTALADGRFVVVWENGNPGDGSNGGDGDGASIMARIFEADGQPSGPEFVINSSTSGAQLTPRVAALGDGGFAVMFVDDGTAGRARVVVFDAHGQRTGEDVLVGGAGGHDIIGDIYTGDIYGLADGRFAVTWMEDVVVEGRLHFSRVVQVFDGRDAGVKLNGTDRDDQYVGSRFNDTLGGGRGHDRLEGNGGNDVLNGGIGADTLIGGIGDDIYDVDNAGDTVIEHAGGGNDKVYASISYTLPRHVEQLIGTGKRGLTLTGNDLNNAIYANAARNTLNGGGGNDSLYGQAGSDTLKGGAGNDKLWGGKGKDVLTGGKGKDIFVFDTRPNKKTNLDTIKDFNVKDDTLWLDNKVFTKLGKKGSPTKPAKLAKKFFTIGDKAKDKNDYLIYNKKTGVLSYDADGSGKGKAVEIAKLSKNLKLTANDFFVI